jgi:pimeloyl-ACP methyl ester carboxylesterase
MNANVDRETSKPPSPLLTLTEIPRAFFEMSAFPLTSALLSRAARGDGHPVLVLPGFSTTDLSTKPLRQFLSGQGYDVHAWELGRNFGPRAIGANGERLIARLEDIYAKTGQKVSLVGWSLGGVLARQLARRRSHMVRHIVTLGSPFNGDPRATSVWRLYEWLTGQKIDDPATMAQLSESRELPPVPATSIYSKSDGIVAWQNCLEPKSDHTENIEVIGSHCGLGINGLVLYAVANRLAQAEGAWKPFAPAGLSAWMYPSRTMH